MAEYHAITQEELEAFLFPQGFKPLAIPGCSELVYGLRIDVQSRTLTLRVYSGIVRGESRECGQDAIRVVVARKFPDGRVAVVKSATRVHRVKGWRKNLQARIEQVKQEESQQWQSKRKS